MQRHDGVDELYCTVYTGGASHGGRAGGRVNRHYMWRRYTAAETVLSAEPTYHVPAARPPNKTVGRRLQWWGNLTVSSAREGEVILLDDDDDDAD